MNETCRTCERVMRTYEWVMSHVWMHPVTHKCLTHMHVRAQQFGVPTNSRFLTDVNDKLQVSFAEYRLCYRALLQNRPIVSRSLLIVATPYNWCRRWLTLYEWVMSHTWMNHVTHTWLTHMYVSAQQYSRCSSHRLHLLYCYIWFTTVAVQLYCYICCTLPESNVSSSTTAVLLCTHICVIVYICCTAVQQT